MADKKEKKQKARFFLVDYENVHMSGLRGIEELRRSDTVVVFYSQNADSLSFEVMKMISSTKAHVEYIKVDTQGRNALDFQLSSYIGFILGREKDSRCYIVSNDRGYVNVQIFWFKQGEKVKLVPSIQDRHTASIKRPAIEEALASVEALSPEEKAQAADLIWAHVKTGSPHLAHIKTAINNDLMHCFKNEQCKAIFNAIRPMLK